MYTLELLAILISDRRIILRLRLGTIWKFKGVEKYIWNAYNIQIEVLVVIFGGWKVNFVEIYNVFSFFFQYCISFSSLIIIVIKIIDIQYIYHTNYSS